jgi:UDP-N-acetyl-D-glucosamine dehydrogenase
MLHGIEMAPFLPLPRFGGEGRGEALHEADAVVLTVRHEAYLSLNPDEIVRLTGRPVAIVDCFGMLDDARIRRYLELGCEVKGLGRGHIKRIKDEVRGMRNETM